MPRASEGKTHWYDSSGKPSYTIIGANGNERATTLRDARKLQLFPSVTTVIGISAKPALENWKIDQALMAALTLPRDESESLDGFMARAKRDAKEQGMKAAERGTEIHAEIEKGFLGQAHSESYRCVRAKLDEIFPNQDWTAEDSFSHPLGYGGKIDLYSDNIFVDFKTKDKLSDKPPVYDEHGMQLSAYAAGMNVDAPIRVSIFIDRADTSKVVAHVWEEESHQRHLDMFLSLLNYWQLLKNYKPEV